jgi:hypothetical protein
LNDTLDIPVADRVPLANEGEEAIVHGIAGVLSEGRPVASRLFDNVPEMIQGDSSTVFPLKWRSQVKASSFLSA